MSFYPDNKLLEERVNRFKWGDWDVGVKGRAVFLPETAKLPLSDGVNIKSVAFPEQINEFGTT